MTGERIVIASPAQADDEVPFLIIKNEVRRLLKNLTRLCGDPRAPHGTISEIIIKIIPARIERFDQVNFLVSRSTLNLLLSCDCTV